MGVSLCVLMHSQTFDNLDAMTRYRCLENKSEGIYLKMIISNMSILSKFQRHHLR